MRCQLTQFSNSRLPGADVGASYKNVKWRTPPNETDGENARIKMQSRRSCFTTKRATGEITGAKLRELFPVAQRRWRWLRLAPLARVPCFRVAPRRRNIVRH